MKKQSACKLLGPVLAVLLAATTQAGNLQLLSVRDPSIAAPTGGGGDSGSPIISDDGRFVVFASTAANLTTNRGDSSGYAPHWINVFVRDRVNSNTTLASVTPSGTSGSGDSLPSGISTNGQFVLFESSADNLVSGDTNGTTDAFVRDMLAGTTTLVSVSTNGTSGNGPSRNAVITPDGRYVAFTSSSSNLVANDQNAIPDIFVRDLQSQTTTLASVGAVPVDYTSYSEAPEISDNGNYVAFFSTATNLVTNLLANASLPGDIYVRNLSGGNTYWASIYARTAFGRSNNCINFKLSTDGQTIAFESRKTNIIMSTAPRSGFIFRYNLQTSNTDVIYTNATIPLAFPEDIHNLDMTPDGRFVTYLANTNTCVFMWDAQTGTNILVNQTLLGGIPSGLPGQSSVCNWARMDASGRYVVFHCSGTNLVANTLTTSDNFYVRDMQNGTTTLLNVDGIGLSTPISAFTPPVISAQSTLVAFAAPDGNLVPNDRNRYDDVFVCDIAGSVELVSTHDSTLPSQSPRSFSGVETFCLSTNGRYAAFSCDADDLVLANTNQTRGVFVHDSLTGANVSVSTGSNGAGLDTISAEPSISADGRYVAFSTFSSNCVVSDNNNFEDVFVRDLQSGTNFLVSVNTNGGFGDADSFTPQISADARYVLFRSRAKNLGGPATGSGITCLFLRDLQLHTNYSVLTNGSLAFMTPDGRFIAGFSLGNSIPTSFALYVWDTSLAKRVFTNTSGLLMFALSPHGHWLAAVSNTVSTLKLFDLNANTNVSLAHGYFLIRDTMQFTDDERYLVYSTGAALLGDDSNTTNDVYLYDTLSGTNQLISRRFNATTSPNSGSYLPAISPDGRFIAYTSWATNATAHDSNGVTDVYLFDRASGVTVLVSASRFDGSTANFRSAKYAFSADSKVFTFRSLASDLTDNDFNPGADLYAVFLDSLIVTDSDSDGMDDAWEMKWFGTLARDGTGDFDGDGVSDHDEFIAGTDPTDPDSAFKAQISDLHQTPTVSWPMVLGKNYRVQFKDDVIDNQWQDLPGNQIVVGSQGQIQDANAAADRRFYRIVLDNNGN